MRTIASSIADSASQNDWARATEFCAVRSSIAVRCKATPPQKHGPYYQLSWTRQRKSTTRLVQRGQLATVRKSLRNYKAMRELVDQWIDASAELAKLRLDDERASSHR